MSSSTTRVPPTHPLVLDRADQGAPRRRKSSLIFPPVTKFQPCHPPCVLQHDGGGSDKEIRNQQYDHANGVECLVGSLEEGSGAQSRESLSDEADVRMDQ